MLLLSPISALSTGRADTNTTQELLPKAKLQTKQQGDTFYVVLENLKLRPKETKLQKHISKACVEANFGC